ncbi:MAG TPA: response regulator transcription factor [Thermoanaerobaculia bacterium]|nr:response regulator transcription factor [Thermoanaerobaculia bacterium]
MKRILIVDDHPVVREGLRGILSREDGLDVCAVADCGATAVALTADQAPDLALVDISLPDRSGLDLIADLLKARSSMQVLVSSIHDEALFAERALAEGAAGYVSKHEEAETLVEAVRTVLAGDIYLSPRMHQRLLRRAAGRAAPPTGNARLATLTPRELEVFTLFGEGLSARRIGERLGISIKTVQAHRENIKEKLEIRSASELLRSAFEYLFTQQAAPRSASAPAPAPAAEGSEPRDEG